MTARKPPTTTDRAGPRAADRKRSPVELPATADEHGPVEPPQAGETRDDVLCDPERIDGHSLPLARERDSAQGLSRGPRSSDGQERSQSVLLVDEGERDAEPLTAPADASVSSLAGVSGAAGGVLALVEYELWRGVGGRSTHRRIGFTLVCTD